MCLAVPMQITSVAGHLATCEAKGVRRTVSLTLLDDEEVEVGGYVLVHVGYAIQTITKSDAGITWDLFDEMTAALAQADA